MRLRQLEAFRATVMEGSVTAAAERLKTSQPTLSRMLTELEESVGFALFQRKKGRIRPTADGLQFYEKLGEVYGSLARLKRTAELIAQESNKHLTIAGSPALMSIFLPNVLKHFCEKYPDVQIDLLTQSIPELFNSLQSSDVDLVFSIKLGGLPDHLQTHLISRDYVCALPPEHRLAKLDVIHDTDLQDEKIIRLKDFDNLDFTQHNQLIERHEWWQHANVTTQVSNVGYALVLNGIGIGLLDPFSAKIWQAQGVEIRPFRPRLEYQFVVCFDPNAKNASLSRDFIQFAHAELNSAFPGDPGRTPGPA